MKKTVRTYLLTGGNLGDRFANMEMARRLIQKRIGEVTSASSFYETEAWGVEDQPDYLNQVLEVESKMEPADLLAEIHEIEREMGRERRTKWESRPIDIDILFYGDKILKTKKLEIPHPRLHLRNFVLIPLLEMVPELEHPLFKKTIEELYWECGDELEVILIETEQTQ